MSNKIKLQSAVLGRTFLFYALMKNLLCLFLFAASFVVKANESVDSTLYFWGYTAADNGSVGLANENSEYKTLRAYELEFEAHRLEELKSSIAKTNRLCSILRAAIIVLVAFVVIVMGFHLYILWNSRRQKQKFKRLQQVAKSRIPKFAWEKMQRFSSITPEVLPESALLIIELRTGPVEFKDLQRFFYDMLTFLVKTTQEKGLSMIRSSGWTVRVLASPRDNQKTLEKQQELLNEVLAALNDRSKEHPALAGLKYRYIIQSGVFIGGIVGRNRLQFDLWGRDAKLAQERIEQEPWNDLI